MVLKLDKSDDTTPSVSLTTNIYIKDSSGKVTFNSIADLETGRLFGPAVGNTFLQDSIVVTGLVPGTYEVGVQVIDNSFNASEFERFNIEIGLLQPNAPVLSGVDGEICSGSGITITAVGNNIRWYNANGVEIGTGDSYTFNEVTENDTIIYATQTVDNLESLKSHVQWVVVRSPGDRITIEDNELVAPEGQSYQWYRNNQLVQSSTRRIEFAGVGTYYAVVSNGQCSTTTRTVMFTDIPETKITISQDIDNRKLYVHPGSQVINRVRIFDSVGRSVMFVENPQRTDSEYVIDVSTLKPGMYISQLEGTALYTGKFILGN